MNTQPEALLYNFNDPERLRQIRRYLNRQKVKTRIVTAPEFLHPLGYLFEIPGFHPSSQFNLGSNFSDEMIANYAQTECQFRYCGTAIPFLTVRSTAR